MKKTGIFYGSTTGTTESVARLIADKLGVAPADVHEVSKVDVALVESYDALILGTSTWGDGELQDDWYDGLKVLQGAHLSGKVVALFGCGDSESYSDTFCDAMGLLYEGLKDSGCTFVGAVDDSDYTYSASVAAADGKFVGLALDDVNESDRTDDRVSAWAAQLQAELV
ncbi:flavodoxin FldA [Bacteroides mediterraneensis]|uniref:Flavodoxin n=1 Tax=Bacteroides mediterraneensis TaxID=1841856 RepID=A0ABS2EY87_9BACE|nr:flavodoxin FldA [Bacteroides mediterraneensis]MBM6759274.1 flavodoxin FldA [Bacteroides mediterraneensis]MBM6782551.1 flavodoxin FldA [Bacteroides mediterraneensis]